MSSLKIIHTADLHLDTPFEGLPEEKIKIRRAGQRELLTRLVTLAFSERADLVLLSGDLLDSGNVYGETARLLERTLNSMPCPVVISPGNHDYYGEASPYISIPDSERVRIFRDEKIERADFPKLGVSVFGAGFTGRAAADLLRGFSAEREDGIINLMCIHGEVSDNGRYNPVTQQDIALSGMDYIAFGHIHSASGLKKSGNTYYSWPGCPEGRGFDETGDKRVNVIEIDRESRSVSLRYADISRYRYTNLAVDISGEDPLLAVHRLLPDDTERDIYRIKLTGETEEGVDIRRLYSNLEGMFFHLEISDCTKLKTDVWERAGEDTLRGLFLKKLKERYDASKTPEERELIERAARHGLNALEGRRETEIDY